MPCVGEVEGEQGGVELCVSQGALAEPGGHPSFTPMGRVGMPQRLDGDAHLGAPGPVLGGTEGAGDTGAPHGGGRRRPLAVLAPGGGQEPGRVTMGCPEGAEESAGSDGQGDVPVFGPLATLDLDLEALAIAVRDLEAEGCMEPEAQARDGGAVDRVGQRGGRLEELPDLLPTEDGGETVGGVRPEAGAGVPVACADVWREEAEATGAETQRRGGEAVDILPGQEGVRECLCREAVGGCVGELRPQTDFPDRGGLRPCALATELESRKHVLTQWGHELSPSRS
jgi:hypothetical protein